MKAVAVFPAERTVRLVDHEEGRETFEAAIRDLGVFNERWPRALRGVITGRFPIAGWQEPMAGRAEAIKDVLTVA